MKTDISRAPTITYYREFRNVERIYEKLYKYFYCVKNCLSQYVWCNAISSLRPTPSWATCPSNLMHVWSVAGENSCGRRAGRARCETPTWRARWACALRSRPAPLRPTPLWATCLPFCEARLTTSKPPLSGDLYFLAINVQPMQTSLMHSTYYSPIYFK